MSRARLLAFNALSMLLANIFSKFIIFVGFIFLAQFLDKGLESTYYLVTAFGAIIAINFQDGMVSVTIRKIATDYKNGPHYLGTLYLASFLLAIILAVFAVPAAIIYSRTQLEGGGLQGQFILSACALSACYLVGYGYSAAGTGFKAYEKLYLEAALMVIQAAMTAGVYIYGAGHNWHLSSFFIGLLAVNIVHVIITNIVLILFVVKPEFHFNIREVWETFMEALPLGYGTLLRTLQDRGIHPFFVNHFAGHNQITQFSSPNNLLVQLKFIPLSIRPALFPSLARKADEETEAFQNYSTALMKFLYLIAMPLLILLIVARHHVLPLVTEVEGNFEKLYETALSVFPLVGWAVALSFPSQVLRSLFVAIKKPQFEFYTVLAGVMVLILLDWLLIPRIGVIGAGYAAIACEITIFAYGLWLLSRVGRSLNVLNLFLLPTLCGIIINLLAEYMYGYHWLIGILTVVIGFPVLVLVLRVISPQELAIIREVIKPGSNTDLKQ